MTKQVDQQWLKSNLVGDVHSGEFREVHTSYLRLADAAVKRLAGEMGLAVPNVHWHRDGPAGGWVREGEHKINLLTAVAHDWPKNWGELHWLIAHEMRHLWQCETLRHYGDRLKEETDAERWATEKTGHKCADPYAVTDQLKGFR